MKKVLLVLLVSLFALSLVLASQNQSNDTENKSMARENRVSIAGNNSNMTYGKCVVDSVRLRQECYNSSKIASDSCLNLSQSADAAPVKLIVKNCKKDYKASMKTCKADFKNAKLQCIQTAKPRFFERMRHAFS